MFYSKQKRFLRKLVIRPKKNKVANDFIILIMCLKAILFLVEAR